MPSASARKKTAVIAARDCGAPRQVADAPDERGDTNNPVAVAACVAGIPCCAQIGDEIDDQRGDSELRQGKPSDELPESPGAPGRPNSCRID